MAGPDLTISQHPHPAHLIERGHFGKRFRRGDRVQPPVAGRKKRWWLDFDSWKVNVLVLAVRSLAFSENDVS